MKIRIEVDGSGDLLQGLRVFARLVKLGSIESSPRPFERPGSLRVTIEPVEE
jgi:hypothetical protein